jgi:hypothetical protein
MSWVLRIEGCPGDGSGRAGSQDAREILALLPNFLAEQDQATGLNGAIGSARGAQPDASQN